MSDNLEIEWQMEIGRGVQHRTLLIPKEDVERALREDLPIRVITDSDVPIRRMDIWVVTTPPTHIRGGEWRWHEDGE